MRNWILCALLALVSCSMFAQNDAVHQVLAVRAGIGPAMRTKDIAALEKIWSPEMKVNSPGNTVLDRGAVLKLLDGGQIRYSSFKDVVESTAVFNGTVILMGHEELTAAVGPEAGKPRVRRYTDVWQRNAEGRWMLVARQATYIANP